MGISHANINADSDTNAQRRGSKLTACEHGVETLHASHDLIVRRGEFHDTLAEKWRARDHGKSCVRSEHRSQRAHSAYVTDEGIACTLHGAVRRLVDDLAILGCDKLVSPHRSAPAVT